MINNIAYPSEKMRSARATGDKAMCAWVLVVDFVAAFFLYWPAVA